MIYPHITNNETGFYDTRNRRNNFPLNRTFDRRQIGNYYHDGVTVRAGNLLYKNSCPDFDFVAGSFCLTYLGIKYSNNSTSFYGYKKYSGSALSYWQFGFLSTGNINMSLRDHLGNTHSANMACPFNTLIAVTYVFDRGGAPTVYGYINGKLVTTSPAPLMVGWITNANRQNTLFSNHVNNDNNERGYYFLINHNKVLSLSEIKILHKYLRHNRTRYLRLRTIN